MKLLTLITMTLALTQSVYAQQSGDYSIDPLHSKVGFEIPHLVISSVEGKFNEYEGKIALAEKFNQSSVEAKIKIASIDTSVSKRDDHLRSSAFFDANKHPEMTFVSKQIKGTPKSFKMIGDLTIKGITKKVTFDGQYLGSVVDGYGNQKVAFTAKAKINRKDFGLTWNSMVEAGPVVGDDVTLSLKIQAAKIQVQKAASK